MKHQFHSREVRVPIDAGRQVAQLRHVLRLVQELSGSSPNPGANHDALDEGARIASLYDQAEPVVQRRFDTLATETAAWSAAGVEALLSAGEDRSPAAIRKLAEELEKSLSDLKLILRASKPQKAFVARRHSRAIPSP